MLQFSATTIIYDPNHCRFLVDEASVTPIEIKKRLEDTGFNAQSTLVHGKLAVTTAQIAENAIELSPKGLLKHAAELYWAINRVGLDAIGRKPADDLAKPPKSNVRKKQTIFEFA
jgi:hypothetical protein